MMVNIQYLDTDQKTGKTRFLLKNTNPAFANSIRRAMRYEVPTMTIEEVEFVKNGSPLYDEVLAHRLGLTVLSTDLKGYTVQQECKCEGKGCNNCTLKLVLKAKGAGTVYASELKSNDPKIKPVHPKTIITVLGKGQELQLEATAILGKGKRHVKFSPCLVWYNYKQTITANNNHKDFEKYKQKYPPQIFRDGKIDTKLIEEHELYDACSGVNEEIVKVDYDPTSFIFHVEPFGQLSVKEIVKTAVKILKQKLDELEKQV